MLPVIKTVVKTRPKGYPKAFNHIGDHIRAKRLTGRVKLIELASILNASPHNLLNWEKGKNRPAVKFMQSIVNYLGYCPLFETPKSLGQLVKLKRFYAGVSSKELARKLGIDQSTILRWENTDQDPKDEKIKKYFELYLK